MKERQGLPLTFYALAVIGIFLMAMLAGPRP